MRVYVHCKVVHGRNVVTHIYKTDEELAYGCDFKTGFWIQRKKLTPI